jgi:hypothetical protein
MNAGYGNFGGPLEQAENISTKNTMEIPFLVMSPPVLQEKSRPETGRHSKQKMYSAGYESHSNDRDINVAMVFGGAHSPAGNPLRRQR